MRRERTSAPRAGNYSLCKTGSSATSQAVELGAGKTVNGLEPPPGVVTQNDVRAVEIKGFQAVILKHHVEAKRVCGPEESRAEGQALIAGDETALELLGATVAPARIDFIETH
jgi:hypothetical protein